MGIRIFQFDEFFVDLDQQRFEKAGEPVNLPPKVFAVLASLLENHGKLVANDTLMTTVWKDTFVEEGNIRYCVHSLRKILGDGYIETIPKRGYRFIAKIQAPAAENTNNSDIADNAPEQPSGRSFSKKWLAVSGLGIIVGVAILLGYFYFYYQAENTGTAGTASMKVEPFDVIGGDENTHPAIREGVANAVIFRLAKIPGLNVTSSDGSQNSSQNSETSPANEILKGSYRIESDSVRVNFRITDANDVPVLEHAFVVSEPNQIETEDAIAFRIAGLVDSRLRSLNEKATLANSPLNDEMKEKYLTVREIIRRGDFDRLQEAAGLMERVTTEHSNWAPGWATFATVLVRVHGGFEDASAETAIQNAMKLDASIAEVYVNKGICHYRKYEWDKAETEFLKAIDIDPNLGSAYVAYATMLDFQRRFAEAERQLDRGLELAPYSPENMAAACLHYYYDQKPEKALGYCRDARRIAPNYWLASKIEYLIYVYQNRWDKVLEIDFGTDPSKIEAFPAAKALAGGRVNDYWKLSLDARQASLRKLPSDVALAVLWLKTGDIEKAIFHTEKAVDQPSLEPFRLNADPATEPLRTHPRFIQAMKKMGLDPSL